MRGASIGEALNACGGRGGVGVGRAEMREEDVHRM
jgi:hypothetical protein